LIALDHLLRVENMNDLVSYVVNSIVDQPDDVEINTVEGDSSVLIELSVHPDDRARLTGNDGALLGSIQQVLAIVGGDRKPVLDLLDRDGESSDVESDSVEDDSAEA
jgi:predicted RNA-binding protein YlqC (UPF0109 family)